MGLLSTTYVTNTTVNQIVSPKALEDNTKALEKLSKSTEKLSESIDKGRITLLHNRYAELINKGKLLDTIIKFMRDYVSCAYHIKSGESYNNYRRNLNNYRGVAWEYAGLIYLNEKLSLFWDDFNKTCTIQINNEPLVVVEPNYVPVSDGEANINENEYNKLLNKELLLEKYAIAVEELPKLLYKLLDDRFHSNDADSRNGIAHWATYCCAEKNYYKDMWMGHKFGPIQTDNFKWILSTEGGSSLFDVRVL